jgi:hypothetical protein
MTPLTERVVELQGLRAAAAIAAAALKARREEFDRENTPLILFVRQTAEAVAASETALKAVALERYDITKDKKPAPGIEIKLFKEYVIDEVAAFAWAQLKELCLIPARLDVPAIKKLATVTPLPFVLIDEVPRVTIATDLSKLDLGAEVMAPAPAVA